MDLSKLGIAVTDIEMWKRVVTKAIFVGVYVMATSIAITSSMSWAELQLAFGVAALRGFLAFLAELNDALQQEVPGAKAKGLSLTKYL